MNQSGSITIVVILIVLVGTAIYGLAKYQGEAPLSLSGPQPLVTGIASPSLLPLLTPRFTVSPRPSGLLSVTELKYRLEDSLGPAVACGPPVVPSDYEQQLLAQFPQVKENQEEFTVILMRHTITTTQLSDEEKLLVVKEHLRLSAIELQPTSDMSYTFTFRPQPAATAQELLVKGTISVTGEVMVTSQEPYPYGCPI